MKTIHRHIKPTIKTMEWHIHIEEENGKYTFWEAHLRKDDYERFKEKTYEVTKEQAKKILEENKEYHIETYQSK